MGHSKKQKSHKIVQHVLLQIIIQSEPEKFQSTPNSPIQINQYQNIQIFLMKRKTFQVIKEEFNSGDEITSYYNRNHRIIDDMEKEDRSVQKKIHWKAAGFGSSQVESKYLRTNLIIDRAFTDPNTEKNSIAFRMTVILNYLDPSKGIKLVQNEVVERMNPFLEMMQVAEREE
ncbi:6326_t:CDS:2 [Entrophospora sp. SA101]|nr:5742_t:CDS:2 [Entrophospora sp. SA101]CAJ0848419.1 6326_t:CDS:2 [Entrophospora sp. SA101]